MTPDKAMANTTHENPNLPSARPPGSEILDARRHARTLKEFYSQWKRYELTELVRTAITLGDEVDRLREALRSIQSFRVHSEPVCGAYAMQDIAHAALSPNVLAQAGRGKEPGQTVRLNPALPAANG